MKTSQKKKPPSKKSPAAKAPAAKPRRPSAPAAKASPPKPAPPKKRATTPPVEEPSKRARKKKGAPAAEAQPAAETQAQAAPPSPPPPATPPVVIAPVDSDADEIEVPGEAIDGKRLAMGLLFALRVTPKEGELVFTRDADGLPLVSGHDQRRCHTAYLSDKAAFHLESSVPQVDARRLAKALLGLTTSMVRVGADGAVLIRHGLGQPPMRFMLGVRAITQRWRPPSQEGREHAVGALAISAAWSAAARKWGNAIARAWQSADGIEWCTLTDAETGELLARAVLAEDGRDLYPEDDRQTEIPGSRTAGRPVESAFVRAVRESEERATANEYRERTQAAPPVLRVDGQEVAEGAGDTRVWLRREVYGAFSLKVGAAFLELIDRESLDVEAVDGWVGAVVPGVARRALGKVADEHGFALYWGTQPPAEPPAEPAGPARLWIEVVRWDALAAEARGELESVEGESAEGESGTAHITWERVGEFLSTEVSGDVAGTLSQVATAAGVDLFEGPEAPTRIWVAQAAWDDLSEAATAALSAPVEGVRLALRGRDGFVTALVPAAAWAAVDRLADEHDVTLHLGANPPTTNATGAPG